AARDRGRGVGVRGPGRRPAGSLRGTAPRRGGRAGPRRRQRGDGVVRQRSRRGRQRLRGAPQGAGSEGAGPPPDLDRHPAGGRGAVVRPARDGGERPARLLGVRHLRQGGPMSTTFLADLVVIVAKILIVFLVLSVLVIFIVWFERKVV